MNTIRKKGESTGYNVAKHHSNPTCKLGESDSSQATGKTDKDAFYCDVVALNFTNGHHKGVRKNNFTVEKLDEEFYKEENPAIAMKFQSSLKMKTSAYIKRKQHRTAIEKCYKCPIHKLNQNVTVVHYLLNQNEKTKMWKCFECGQTFFFKKSLLRQYTAHKVENGFLNKSSSTLLSKENVWKCKEREDVSVPKGEREKCNVCGCKFRSVKALECHMRDDHPEKKAYKCDVCGRQFNREQLLKNHPRTPQEEKPQKCSFCGREFLEKLTCRRHVRTHFGEKPFLCDVSGKTFRSTADLYFHKKLQTIGKTFKCNICGKEILANYQLRANSKIDSTESPYQCGVYVKEFKVSRFSLESHMLWIHAIGKSFKCNMCGQEFSTNSQLKIHAKRHSKKTPYKCDVCGKEFKLENYLKLHVKIHSKVKPYQCTVCDYRGISKRGHNLHIKIHTKVKPYRSDICGREYTQKGTSKKHVRTNAEQKIV